MSLQGNLSGFSLSEIFRMISFSAKTGNLVIARDAAQGRVHFRDGEVYFASTPENRLPLGLRLVDAGIITRENLDDALAEQKDEPGKRLGEILIADGLVARDALAGFVREQIQDALFEIFEWDDGTYYFEPATGTDEDIGLSLSVDEIVVEAERRKHEWDQIHTVLPSMDSRVRLSTNAVALAEVIELDPQEWAAVCQIADGANLYALRGCLHLTSLGLCRMIARMISRGVLEAVPHESASDAPGVAYDESFEATLALYRDDESSEPVGEVQSDEAHDQIVEPAGAAEPEPLLQAVPEPEDHALDMPAQTPADTQDEPAQLVEEEPDPVATIRKYIRSASARDGASEKRKDYPIEWLTYYGRLNHRRSRGPSEAQLRDRAYLGAAAEKS